jgi:hypothetical protein
MKTKTTLFSIFSTSIFAFGIWIVIFFNTDPTKEDVMAKIAFLCSLFLWLAGFLTIVGFFIRRKLSQNEIIHANLPIVIRQGILVSFTITLLLTLQLIRVLNLFDAFLIIAAISSTELFFKTRTQHV